MSFKAQDLAHIADLLRETAETEIMPRFRDVAAQNVREKTGPLDLVTEADEAAERVIEPALRARFPGCVVVGEEAAAANPSLLQDLSGADLAFVVDPLDGTANFASGLSLFGVMIAAIVRGEIAASVIHDPVGGATALALRGEGAWMERPDGSRIALHVAPSVPVPEMTGVTSWRYLPEERRRTVCRNLPRIAASWDYRCAAHAYRLAAAGHCHFLFFNRLMPWDHAPGWLLHREAGGKAVRFDGSPYEVTETIGGLICAPDRASCDALRESLLDL
ncbi:MAG: inositol monophosphatase [Acetobacteraceae bacterium]|nr:inositol monophosphatase [Acetobacteraceae bacterium]